MLKRFWVVLMVFALALASCAGPAVPATPTLAVPTATLDPLPPTATFTASPSATLAPSQTASATPFITLFPTDTPAPLATFIPERVLRLGILPSAYIADTCEYLRLRWAEGSSPPGTVVVPVMFHSIVQPGTKITDPKEITMEQFAAFVQYAQYLGFETITTAQLINFLYFNAPIPPRSMILIVDDRRPGLLEEHFMPILEANDWTVTSAYIADPGSFEWAWEWMDRLYERGLLDVQSHGYTGQLYIVPDTTEAEIQNEIWNSTTVLEERFGQRPLAFIWPGGNFTALSVQVARQGGYQLGFTAYSRGPLLFNWIPLGAEEQAVGDPLMVLPRAWSNSVNLNLDEAVKVSEQATAFAQENYRVEMGWYEQYCPGE